MYKLDLHVHYKTRVRSYETHVRAAIVAAIGAGLDGIAFTEHHEMLPAEWIASLNREFAPFKVYSGVEIRATEHVLVFGIRDRELNRKWPSFDDLAQFVFDHHGATCLAHPYRKGRPLRIDLTGWRTHAIEAASKHIKPEDEQRIRELGLVVLSNSDAHKPSQIGLYWNEANQLPADDVDLASMLRAGEIRFGGQP